MNLKYLLQFGMMNLIYLMDHKIADEITSVGKSKSKKKEKKDEPNEIEIYIPSEKRQQFIDELRLF